jgi:hypothetical protein
MSDLSGRPITTAPAGTATNLPYIQWGPVIAGALAAAALASVLHAFAGAIGLALSSTAPTWRDASTALVLLSGLYLILVALAAYGLGGYLAGRLRAGLSAASPDEMDFRDGVHGLLVWSLATLLTALLLLVAASATTRLAAPSGGTAGPSTSVAGENIIALDTDRLLRGERRAGDADVTQTRAEVARVLLTSSSHSGVAAEDRAYLVRLVATRTGLAPADAERRVDTAIANARDNIARARRATVIMAFMAGSAALLGAAAAWFAASAGGKHRDENGPSLRWTLLGPRMVVRR